ncbi:MAG: transporter substrate-binding domain-containing protein [Marinobacter sp.]|uniref:ATP-binding protein n=1 Tax=Marinobacter sp. TaxID=50741 RepID=UPI00299D6BF2|nr:transporter substrate-binding domain-containing protein [Marinobacter sp.]MDX1633190.1 transporter substrate-binding domain-containing protein [Marinobacter sp.]
MTCARRWCLPVCLLLSLLVLMPQMGRADPPVTSPLPVLDRADLNWLAQQGELNIGVRPGQIPLAFVTAEGELAGTYIDYLNRIGTKLDTRVDLVAASAADSEAMLARGELDAMLRTHAPGQPVPAGLAVTAPLMSLTYGLFVDAGDASIQSLSDLEGRRLALIGDDSNQYRLLEPVESFRPVPVSNVGEAVSKVLSGQADAFLGPMPVVSDYLQAALINGIGLASLLDGQATHVVLAVSEERRTLLRVLNRTVNSFNRSEHQAIREAWVPFTVPRAASEASIQLTQIEQEWLKRNPNLRVMFRSNWPPFEFTQDGELRGLVPDLVGRIEDSLGVSFSRETTTDWSAAEQALLDGEVDILAALPRSPRREDKFLLSRTYLSLPIALAIRDDGRFIGDLRELRDERVGVVRQQASHDYLLINHPDINIFPMDSVEEGLLALSNGDLEVMVTHIPGVSYTVARLGLSNLRITSITPYQYELQLAVSKERPELLRIINKSLTSLEAGDTEPMYNRWIHLDVEQEPDYTVLKRVVLIAIVVVLIFLYWNRKLSREVDERIRSENALRRSEDDLRAAKLEAERLAREAETANRAKSEFLANMSHEIRTPMNAVIGYSDLLSERVTDPQLRQYLDAIRAGSRSLLMLINDILDLSRIEAGKMRLEFAPLEVKRLLDDVRHIFDLRAREQGIELRVTVDASVPRAMVLDEARLRQVLFNLVGNAIKFTHEGRVDVYAAARAQPRQPGEAQRHELIVTVNDTGIGIPRDQQERIFDAFEQQEGQSNRKYGGTGLGLAISRKLARMMGGELSVRSAPGQGSTFTVRLPGVEATLPETDTEQAPAPAEPKLADELDRQERGWLRHQLSRDFGDEWRQVRESGDPEQMREFAERVRDWGLRYRSDRVALYGRKLLEDVETFNLDAINQSLEAFPRLLGETVSARD